MLAAIALNVHLLLFAPGLPAGMVDDALAAQPPATQPASAAASSATTRPAGSVADSLTSAYAKTTLIQLFTGEKKLSPEDLGHFEFWITLVKEPIIATLGFIPRIFVAVLFYFIFWIIYRAVRKVALGSMKTANVDPSIRDMFAHLIKWCIMGFGLVIAFNQIGIQIAALLTGVSIIGLAIGFAAQETLANFIAGIVIFWDKPFKVGDWISVSDAYGQVQRVTFRSTRILNTDGEVIIIPNTSMLSTKLSNHSTNPINRINIPIGIAYKESIDEARAALLAMTTGDSRICKDPPPGVVVKECADSSVNLVLRFWIIDESIERKIFYEYMEKAKKSLDAAGIEIPFPHVQLFVEDTPAIRALSGAAPASRAA